MYPLDDMTISQLFETLIWQATNLEGTLLDYLNFDRDDIDPRDQATLIEEFRVFVQSNQDDVHDFMEATGFTIDHVAHNYILTRNRHGAGFWDHTDHPSAERLSEACQFQGTIDVYISDDPDAENLLEIS